MSEQKVIKKNKLIIEDEIDFNNQVFRKNILENILILANKNKTGKEIFDIIMKDNKEVHDDRREGWIFESLCQILIILKCIENLHY
jgi:hypothetical protein